jgi:hypothetical protein
MSATGWLPPAVAPEHLLDHVAALATAEFLAALPVARRARKPEHRAGGAVVPDQLTPKACSWAATFTSSARIPSLPLAVRAERNSKMARSRSPGALRCRSIRENSDSVCAVHSRAPICWFFSSARSKCAAASSRSRVVEPDQQLVDLPFTSDKDGRRLRPVSQPWLVAAVWSETSVRAGPHQRCALGIAQPESVS